VTVLHENNAKQSFVASTQHEPGVVYKFARKISDNFDIFSFETVTGCDW